MFLSVRALCKRIFGYSGKDMLLGSSMNSTTSDSTQAACSVSGSGLTCQLNRRAPKQWQTQHRRLLPTLHLSSFDSGEDIAVPWSPPSTDRYSIFPNLGAAARTCVSESSGSLLPPIHHRHATTQWQSADPHSPHSLLDDVGYSIEQTSGTVQGVQTSSSSVVPVQLLREQQQEVERHYGAFARTDDATTRSSPCQWTDDERGVGTRYCSISTDCACRWPSFEIAVRAEGDEEEVWRQKKWKMENGDPSSVHLHGEWSGGHGEWYSEFLLDTRSRYELHNQELNRKCVQPDRQVDDNKETLAHRLGVRLWHYGCKEQQCGDTLCSNLLADEIAIADTATADTPNAGTPNAGTPTADTPTSSERDAESSSTAPAVPRSRHRKRSHSCKSHSGIDDTDVTYSGSSSAVSVQNMPCSTDCSLLSTGSKRGVIASGRVQADWEHRSMEKDFPFPIPAVFVYRHHVHTLRVEFESFGFDSCERCTTSPFSSPSNAEAHHNVHGNCDPIFVRYERSSGRWEWFRRVRRNNKS